MEKDFKVDILDNTPLEYSNIVKFFYEFSGDSDRPYTLAKEFFTLLEKIKDLETRVASLEKL